MLEQIKEKIQNLPTWAKIAAGLVVLLVGVITYKKLRKKPFRK